MGATDHIAQAIAELGADDLLRLKALARLRLRGLPGITWADLLHEAILRALDGSRRWPDGVPLTAFLAGVMRSVCDGHWRRLRRERLVPADSSADIADDHADPERRLAAVEALAQLDRLFADDAVALQIIADLASGLSAQEIRMHRQLSETDYDSARRRIRRRLLRDGLAGLGR